MNSIYVNDGHNAISRLKGIKRRGVQRCGRRSQGSPTLRIRLLIFSAGRFHAPRFLSYQGPDLPAVSLANPDFELVDLFGNGLPDVLQMNGGLCGTGATAGNGTFDLPRPMQDAPPVALAAPGVQLIDANGDGRSDLVVTQNGLAGYYSLEFDGGWDRNSFQRYHQAPSFNLEDPEVRLIDLTGDGVTDVIRSGTRLECFFNDPHQGWLP